MSFLNFSNKKQSQQIEELQNELANKSKEIERLSSLVDKYGPLVNMDNELSRMDDELVNLQSKKDELTKNYQDSLSLYARLKNDISVYESKLDLIDYGIYEPIYNFETSEQYKENLLGMREEIKQAVRMDQAAKCDVKWTIDGSLQKGRSSTLKRKKLMIRAFNGECDVIVSKVRWNNVSQMKERIIKIFESLNKLGTVDQTYITGYFRDLRIKELQLEYEYQQKKYEEKEKEREIRERLREEERAQKEFQREKEKAEKEENTYNNALEKAKKDLIEATEWQKEKLRAQIQKLEKLLYEAHARKERAISMAQQTRCGHVYIISNIGSFGENIHKIGMTRRLEPLDRINELGNASVPFKFDVHALIYSEDAPTLENRLHKKFEGKRVNLVNNRKEYFKATLDEIEKAIKEFAPDAEFIKIPEAREYRETKILISKNNQESIYDNSIFIYPDSI